MAAAVAVEVVLAAVAAVVEEAVAVEEAEAER